MVKLETNEQTHGSSSSPLHCIILFQRTLPVICLLNFALSFPVVKIFISTSFVFSHPFYLVIHFLFQGFFSCLPMSNPWDADLKKYRAKRMSVSGHVQPNSFAMNKQSQVLQIDALVESDDDVDEESEDDDDTHSIQRSVDQAESSGLPENAPGTPLSVTSGFEVASPSIDSTNKSPPTDPSLIPPHQLPPLAGPTTQLLFFHRHIIPLLNLTILMFSTSPTPPKAKKTPHSCL